jgi:hypothetical protein
MLLMPTPVSLPAAPRRRVQAFAATLAIFGAATLACRTGTGPTPRTPAAPRPDFIRSYVGQTGFLRYGGDRKQWSLDRKAVERQSGGCDVAVEVKSAAFQKGVVQLGLESLGQPRVEGKRSLCRRMEPAIALRVTGFQPDESAEAVSSAVGRLLVTPEALLAAHGIRFDLPAVAEQTLVADRSPVGKAPEIRLAQEVTRWPKKLLWVEPAYADPNPKVKHEGEVEIAAIVGSDGRLREPKILTTLADTHQRHVERAFSLWRFEPARRGTQAVAARVTERTVLRID